MPITKEQVLDRAIQHFSKKPLAEQSLYELSEFFEATKDLTYVFVATSSSPADREDAFGPNYITAIDLALCNRSGMKFRRPFSSEVDAGEDNEGLLDYRRRIQSEVEARISLLRQRSNTSFVLIWSIEGFGGETHLEHSPNLSDEDVRDELISSLSGQMYDYMY